MDVPEILTSALVAAVVGGGFAEWRARAAEGRSTKREIAAEARAATRERIRLEQDELIAQIEDTRRDFQASRNWLLAYCLGDSERMAATPRGRGQFVGAAWYLIGDEALLRQIFDYDIRLMSSPAGSGISEADTATMGALMGHVNSRLDAQRALVREGKHPIYPTAAFLQEMIDKASDHYGVPVEYRPKLNLDAPNYPEDSALKPPV